MEVACPNCRQTIPMDDVHIATDVAVCRRCERKYSYSELEDAEEFGQVDLSRPPKGVWVDRKPNGFELGFSTRSIALALFLIPFTLIWSGISLGGIYGSQIAKGEFDLAASLFGLPFLLGTCILIPAILMCLWGRQVLTVDHRGAELFTGFGRIGRRRQFQWNEIREVTLEKRTSSKGRVTRVVSLIGEKSYYLTFGSHPERAHFAVAFLRPLVGDNRS